MRNKTFTSALLVIFCCCQLQPGLMAFGSSAVVLGQIVSKDARIDGVTVTSGVTLFNKSVVETGQTPAFIHMSAGPVVEISRESAVYFEKTQENAIQVSVHKGALTFQEDGGETVAVTGSDSQQQTAEQTQEPGQGQVAVLVRDAVSGRKVLVVDSTAQIASTAPILIVSPDGESKEIHYIKSLKSTEVEMTADLQLPFPAQSLVYQGSRLDIALARGTPMVGTVASAGGGGVSSTALILIVVGGGAAAGAAAAFSKSGGDGGGEPPATQVTP